MQNPLSPTIHLCALTQILNVTELPREHDETARRWCWRCLLRRVSYPLPEALPDREATESILTQALTAYSCAGLACFECCEICC